MECNPSPTGSQFEPMDCRHHIVPSILKGLQAYIVIILTSVNCRVIPAFVEAQGSVRGSPPPLFSQPGLAPDVVKPNASHSHGALTLPIGPPLTKHLWCCVQHLEVVGGSW